MAKESGSTKEDVKAKDSAFEAPKKKILTNKRVITLILTFAVVVAVILFVTNLVRGKFLGGGEESSVAKQQWTRISDELRYMIESADLDIKFVNSQKRTQLNLIGSNEYYSVLYSNNRIYVSQGSYSTPGMTDEQKISEAKDNLSGGKQIILSSNVPSFSVEGYNAGTDSFTNGTATIRFRIDLDNGDYNQDVISVKIPEA